MNTPKRVHQLTLEALDDFAKDRVTYLELRSTPRYNAAHDLCWNGSVSDTGEEYVEAIIGAIEQGGEGEYLKRGITVRLLLSCNRAHGVARATQVIDLAIRFSKRKRFSCSNQGEVGDGWVVGVEFSGNPYIGAFVEYQKVFRRAMEEGLCCSIHCGETKVNSYYPTLQYKDTADIIQFIQEMVKNGFGFDGQRARLRVGHMLLVLGKRIRIVHVKLQVCLDGQWERFWGTRVPIEICPTSNEMTMKLYRLSDHPTFCKVADRKHPFCLCTDDSGVFRTSLSAEYLKMAQAFDLDSEDVRNMARSSFEHAFASVDKGPSSL